MANRIKGITVEIGGDTTKLSKALESVNKNIKNTQTLLKDVQKLLKLDPSNTELLSQKHKLLTDAVKATKEKLETLKMAAEQANQALDNTPILRYNEFTLQAERRKDTNMRIISNNLKEIRKAKKITQGQLAEMVGCSQGRIGDYESGRCTTENITLGVALKISNALGCTIEEIFTAEEQV